MEIVDGKPYLDQAKNLIVEYTERLGRDLAFQNIDDELKDLSRKYAGQEGALLVAIDGKETSAEWLRITGIRTTAAR